MNNTLKTLSTIVTPEFNSMSLEQLAEAYTEGLNPSVLATAFSKTFVLIIDISRKFFGFTEEDIASYSLETLDKCLQTYNNAKAAFSTYFTTVFRNKLRTESQLLSTQKRKSYLYSNSLEVDMENGFDIVDTNQNDNVDGVINELTTYGLTERELRYCKYILEGYTNKEISEIFNTSVMTLSNIRKKLKIKLATLCL